MTLKKLSLIGTLLLSSIAQANPSTTPAPQSEIPDQYIVLLNMPLASGLFGLNSVENVAHFVLGTIGGGELGFVYKHAVTGFSVRLPAALVPVLEKLPIVKHVEPDQYMSIGATQVSPVWGLDRIDQTNLPLNQSFIYADSAGQGSHVYIIDTGIRASHSEVVTRVGTGRNFAANSSSFLFGGSTDPNNTNDCNGHGTHVAGTAVGTQYGVAKKATVYPIRVLGCNGSGANSGVIAGVDWVAANHKKPAVANMSLGGASSTALDTAVNNAIAAGVTFVAAAGNDNANACNGSPNRVLNALTVASSDIQDRRSSFSNHGSCVDLFAPGTGILSASHNSDTATATLSGTSMAAPHVAGAAALYLSGQPSATPAQVAQAILVSTSNNVISNVNGSPNKLLNTSQLGGTVSIPTPPEPEPEPTPDQPPCTGCTSYTINLSAGQSGYAPSTAGFSFSGGQLEGFLRLPSGLSAELYLERQQRFLFSSSWTAVVSNTGSAAEKNLSANVSSGTYRWRVRAISGQGQARFYGKPR